MSLLQAFANDLPEPEEEIRESSEAEFIGQLVGFIIGSDPDITVERESAIGERFRADLLLHKGRDTVVVELKRGGNRRFLDAAVAQLITYLREGDIDRGIVFVAPTKRAENLKVDRIKSSADGKEVTIVAPGENKAGDYAERVRVKNKK